MLCLYTPIFATSGCDTERRGLNEYEPAFLTRVDRLYVCDTGGSEACLRRKVNAHTRAGSFCTVWAQIRLTCIDFRSI